MKATLKSDIAKVVDVIKEHQPITYDEIRSKLRWSEKRCRAATSKAILGKAMLRVKGSEFVFIMRPR